MKYFFRITSLADLKRQYRQLAVKHHPDRGGSTEAMQEVNAEFEKQFDIWKDRKEVDLNGYENDFMEAKTSQQYEQHVWNEYRWKGSRCGTKSYWELAEEFRKFVKEAYPNCKFSIRKESGRCTYYISLETADFEAFTEEYKATHGDHLTKEVYGDLSRWSDCLTPRAIEVMSNVIDYCESFNYDNSDIMTDYFDVGFYAYYRIGNSKHYFKYEPLAVKTNEKVYIRRSTPTERKIQEALGSGNTIGEKKQWNEQTQTYVGTGKQVLMDKSDLSNEMGYALQYSQPSLFRKRLDKMTEVGIRCHPERSYIVVDGFTPELQAQLDKERAEEDAREAAFYAKQNKPSSSKAKPAKEQTKQSLASAGEYRYIDYSDRAFAIVGDTKSIVPLLKELGGSYNPRLSCGAGWIFPKSKEEAVRNALNLKAA